MKSDNYWRIFIESGSPDAYINYKKAKKMELREQRSTMLNEFSEEFDDAHQNRRDSD